MTKFLSLLFLSASTSIAAAATAVPHRAIYDMTLLKASEGASLSSVTGRLAFEVQGSTCEGWTVNYRMVNQFRPMEGDVKLFDTQSSSFESGDALEMHVSQKDFLDGKLTSETRIKVNRPAPGREAEGVIEKEPEERFAVAAEALFPMQHQLHMMDLAESGAARDSSLIYDGSEDKASYRAITFIGKRRAPGTLARDMANGEAKPLSQLPSWPISMSYYKQEEAAEAEPSYQVSFDLYENGVATGLVLDYGSFVLSGELTKLEMLPAQGCP
ncbi:MAG: DUF1849 family protein [Alphaproteobacteria bacterium]|nr:DUF1849 family protein [Alphaproteobacteria bacterium]